MSKDLIIIIMAGGLGKRMNSCLPKVLHMINGHPMLVCVTYKALKLNPKKILIVVGKYKFIIKSTLNEYIDLSKIQFIDQQEAQGTGHAIMCCRDYLLNHKNSNILVLSGDIPLIETKTMQEMILNLNKVRIMTTILDNSEGYGRIIEINNKFKKIVEEKDCNEEQKLIKKTNCGIYSFDCNILCKYLPYIENNNTQNEYYLTDIIQIIKNYENIDIDMYLISKEQQMELTGVNTKEQLDELNRLIKI